MQTSSAAQGEPHAFGWQVPAAQVSPAGQLTPAQAAAMHVPSQTSASPQRCVGQS
jgi:hypothetical protein